MLKLSGKRSQGCKKVGIDTSSNAYFCMRKRRQDVKTQEIVLLDYIMLKVCIESSTYLCRQKEENSNNK